MNELSMNELSMNELYDVDGGADTKVNIDIKITSGDVLKAAKYVYKEAGQALHNTFGCTQCWFNK